MSFRLVRNFTAWCLLTFIVVVAWHFTRINRISISSRDAGMDAIAAILITLVHFVISRLSWNTPGARPPRPRRFLGQVFLRLAGLYLILALWSGLSYEWAHHSFHRPDVRAIVLTEFPAVPVIVIFLFWVIFSEWWSAYALAGKTTPVLNGPVIAPAPPAAPIPVRREKPAFLTLDIYPKR